MAMDQIELKIDSIDVEEATDNPPKKKKKLSISMKSQCPICLNYWMITSTSLLRKHKLPSDKSVACLGGGSAGVTGTEESAEVWDARSANEKAKMQMGTKREVVNDSDNTNTQQHSENITFLKVGDVDGDGDEDEGGDKGDEAEDDEKKGQGGPEKKRKGRGKGKKTLAAEAAAAAAAATTVVEPVVVEPVENISAAAPDAALSPFKAQWRLLMASVEAQQPLGEKQNGKVIMLRAMFDSSVDESVYKDREDDSFTMEEVVQQRFLIFNSSRDDALDLAERDVLGDQYGDGFTMFNTSFSYEIPDHIQTALARAGKPNVTPDRKLDILLGITKSLHDHSTWLYDHEYNWGEFGGKSALQSLARTWKTVLAKSDLELNIDPLFMRKGIEYFLREFKKEVENMECGGIKFNFE